ncbi:MAG: hypothetical protein ACKPDI_10900 [Actinomycetota bacterium]
MNKTWITALTVAGVAGSAGAAFAGVAANDGHQGQVEAQGITAISSIPSTNSGAGAGEASYRVGSAGTVTISNTAGVISVQSALPSAGWTVVGYTNPAGHVEVQFTNGLQTVTFSADVVGGVTVASLALAPNPGVVDTTVAAPMELEPITSPVLVPAPLPATPGPTFPAITFPAATPAPPVTVGKQPAATTPTAPKQTPAPVTTTSTSKATSSSGGSHEDDDEDEGYENEEEDDD